jgi:prolyl 4-hydroxylase
MSAVLPPNSIRKIGGDPQFFVYEIPSLLTPSECASVRAAAIRKGMSESVVYATSTDVVDTGSRISKTGWLDDNASPAVEKITSILESLTGLPRSHYEDLQVVQYPVGGFFKPHHDCCEGSDQTCARMNAGAGARKITMLIYINDDYEGGETAFPLLDLNVVPETGKAIMFWSVDDKGKVIEKSLHGGNPIISGEKWVCNKWVHEGPFV